MKDLKKNATVEPKMLGRHQAYNAATKQCNLCLNENLRIALRKGDNMLNKQTQVLNEWRYKIYYSLACYDIKDQLTSAKKKPLHSKQFNVTVYLAEDCCRTSIKLKIPNQVVSLFENPTVILYAL